MLVGFMSFGLVKIAMYLASLGLWTEIQTDNDENITSKIYLELCSLSSSFLISLITIFEESQSSLIWACWFMS